MICSSTNLSEKNLALTILYIQKCNTSKAEDYLQNITKENLVDLLLDNWDLLFETTFIAANNPQRVQKGTVSFSDLTVVLISICPEILSEIFVTLIVDKKVIGLGKMIKVSLGFYLEEMKLI